MSTTQLINGTSYTLPANGETDYAAQLLAFFSALATSFSTIIFFGVLNITNGTTYPAPGLYATISGATEPFIAMPMAGRLKRLYVTCVAPPTGGSCIFTVRVNGVDTALTLTVLAGVSSGSDLVNSVVVAAGDRISMKCVATATSATMTFPVLSMAFVPA